MNAQLLAFLPILAYLIIRIYFRSRRSIGRQKLEPGRLTRSIVIWVMVCALVVSANLKSLPLLVAIVVGMALGAGLAAVALRLTRFEITEQGAFYTVPSYIGLGIVVLLAGRIVYRLIQVYPLIQATAAAGGDPRLAANLSDTPLTMGLFGLVVGYYLMFYIGLLWLVRRYQRAGVSA